MKEVALVFDQEGKAVFWPMGETGAACIPDSRSLWDVLWQHRQALGGVAHTHPWDGKPGPSTTDVTTWDAVERGLGKMLLWPIVSMTHVAFYVRNPLTKEFVETPSLFTGQVDWEINVNELRLRSRNGG